MIQSQAEEQQAWDDYIVDNGGHPLQLSGWGEVKAAHGWKAKRMYFYSKDDYVIGAAQILVKKLPWPFKSLAYVPRGPIIEGDNKERIMTALSTYVKQAYGSVAVMIEPDGEEFDCPEGWKKTTNHILPNKTVVLDLDVTEETLLGKMSKKTRQYIRKSKSDGIEIKMVKNREELAKCLDIYRLTAKRAKFSLHKDKYYYDIFEKMGDYSPVFAAYHDGQIVAFLWLAITADKSYELYGGMNDTGQQLRANYALKWHAIEKCKEWGLTSYDFGGLLEGGVSTFKLGWAEGQTVLPGAFVKPLSGSYVIWSTLLPLIRNILGRIKKFLSRF